MAAARRLCLYLPYLPTDRARRDQPRVAGPPRALVLTRAEGSSVLVAGLDARARQFGLRAGMSLAQAQAIVPGLLSLPHDPRGDRAALRRLADWALRFSPLVEAVEPDTLLLDITGCERLFGGEANIARQAVDGLARQGFLARAAIAETVGAAYALAHAGSEPLSIVPPGRLRAYLAPLPPAALRIDPQVSARLDSLGVRTIGDLLGLPRKSLPARFGGQLVRRLQQALGEVFEGVASREPEEVLQARIDFEGVVRDLSAIQAAADRALAEVFAQIQQRGRALRRLDCVPYFECTPPVSLSVGLVRASRSREHIARLLRERLERLDLSAGVCGLVLVAGETSAWRAGQGGLFEPGVPGEEEQFGHLLDALANRLGDSAVVRAQLLDDYQPERSFRYVSVAETGCQSAAGVAPADTARPVQLFSPPVPIRVISRVPDGPPGWFAWRGREYVVGQACGPERLETAWWRGRDVRRDYFRVTAASGEQFWIFHACDERCWYLHGIFA